MSLVDSDSHSSLTQKQKNEEEIFAEEIRASKIIQSAIKLAIEKVGNQGRYQKWLIVFLIACNTFTVYLLLGSTYFFMNPKFICNGEVTSEQKACQNLSLCHLENDYTVTAYTELYCGDKRVMRNLIQAMLGVGACIGVLFINFFADYKGRKISFLLSVFAGILSIIVLIIGSYTKNVNLFIISNTLSGFCGNSVITTIYIMSDRLMSQKYSKFCILISNAFFGLGQISLILFTGPLDWQDLVIYVMLIPSIIIFLVICFFVVEDPAFLFNKQKMEECYKMLRKMAVMNKKTDKIAEAEDIIKELQGKKVHIVDQNDGKKVSKLKYLHLLKKRQIMIAILFMGVWNLGGNVNYYLLGYSISDTGYSYGIQITLFGIFQFLGILPMMFFGDRIPRKFGLIVIFVSCTVVSIPFLFSLSAIIQTILIVFIRFVLVSQYMLYIFVIVQTFPQHITSTCMGVIQFVSQLGKFIAPFSILLSDSLDISAILVLGMVSLISIPFVLPLKQTIKAKKNKQDKLTESMISTAQE